MAVMPCAVHQLRCLWQQSLFSVQSFSTQCCTRAAQTIIHSGCSWVQYMHVYTDCYEHRILRSQAALYGTNNTEVRQPAKSTKSCDSLHQLKIQHRGFGISLIFRKHLQCVSLCMMRFKTARLTLALLFRCTPLEGQQVSCSTP